MISISYEVNPSVSVEAFINILHRSTLSERRPVENQKQIQGMLEHADLIITANEGKKCVGIARCVTDFHYCCYLSDLAVDSAYQHRGIGKALVDQCKAQLQADPSLCTCCNGLLSKDWVFSTPLCLGFGVVDGSFEIDPPWEGENRLPYTAQCFGVSRVGRLI